MANNNGSDAGGGLLLTTRRPPFFTYLLRLYTSDATFRNLADLAVIGAVVLAFMGPAAKGQLGSTASPSGSAAQRPAPAPQAVVPQTPTPGPVTSQQPARPPEAPAAATATTSQVALRWPREIAQPSLLQRQLVEVDPTQFRSSSVDDQARLARALNRYAVMQYADVLEELKEASRTDRNVAFLRGLAHAFREPAEYRNAAEQLRAAANAGHRQASAVLGALLVAAPREVTKNVAEGKRLIEAAAENGDPLAKRLAGIGYVNGDFGTFDAIKGATLLRAAAEAGDPAAMMHYARILYDGLGIAKDPALAEEYLRRAATAGLTTAQEAYGNWIVARYKARELSDPAEGARWLDLAYQAGMSASALVELGLLYFDHGRDLPWNDREKGFGLFERCAGLNFGPCLFAYATAFHFAKGTSRDLIKAYAYYELARQRGSRVAAERMASVEKFVTPEDKKKALDLAHAIRFTLKPPPSALILQRVEIRPPEPWAAPAQSVSSAALTSEPAPN